jgi:hypothetical protein
VIRHGFAMLIKVIEPLLLLEFPNSPYFEHLFGKSVSIIHSYSGVYGMAGCLHGT